LAWIGVYRGRLYKREQIPYHSSSISPMFASSLLTSCNLPPQRMFSQLYATPYLFICHRYQAPKWIAQLDVLGRVAGVRKLYSQPRANIRTGLICAFRSVLAVSYLGGGGLTLGGNLIRPPFDPRLATRRIAIDNVLAYSLVLPNGTIATANEAGIPNSFGPSHSLLSVYRYSSVKSAFFSGGYSFLESIFLHQA
jgi:hypothetical protein